MKNRSLPLQIKAEKNSFLSCLAVFVPLVALLVLLSIQEIPEYFRFFLLLFAGWFSWTFSEYCIHRFYMHKRIPNLNQKLYQSHENHHRHPSDIRINVMQRILASLLGGLLLYLSFVWNNYFTVFTGYYLGFLGYALMHYILHQTWAAYLFPRLQESHIHHHGKYPDKCFSFSCIWWDKIFDTLPPKNARISDKFRKYYFSNPYHKESGG
ncbi:Sterol desaturase/sphingolipid hydroxylase, fatty acid hydroxylase superfamily [Cyclobacterium lianum]|uniref:Sterol desaturase/sphingolipid hydroxylase, fatty acid hydroxylase superfamily n=1 Tax=Cyclobacterium lianum TaxID=388280 RepID=A0A1M7NW22_9BACT|nr:sterol desaturase family protein [Cyclobacterium lianum]SHN08206.1 Sterol desaturase/sphingolipid hydroxylase, fatty acid hydroxylase superfamily [Cyclobacterium lianum]